MTDRYEILSQMGEDVLGSVYLANDTMLQRRVMFRHIEYGENPLVESRDDTWRKEFSVYAGRLSTMQHPNMLTIYDISIEESGAFVVTQVVEGESLAERLQRGALGQLGVKRMAADILEALHAAHQSEIFHGALHTGSVKRVHRASGGHRALLVDLGLNQLTSMVRAEKVKVADPVLMAPELHEADREPDAKADLYMLGQLCYTALVGGHPYSDKTTGECLEIYRSQGMPPLEDYVEGVQPELAAWVMKLLETDPDKRPADTGEAMVELHTIQLDEPEPNVPGKTHAVEAVENPVTSATGATLVRSQAGYAGVRAATGSVHIAAAITAAAGMNLTQGQVVGVEEARAAMEREKKKNRFILAAVSGAVLLVVVGLAIGPGADKSRGGNQEPQTAAAGDERGVRIGKATMVNTVARQETPVVVDLDGENSLDWLVLTGVPSSSKRVEKVDGLYIQGVNLIEIPREHGMLENPVRFKSGGKVMFPGAAANEGVGAKPGAGYEITLRVPAKQKQSVTADLYVVQKFCDIRVEVTDPRSDETAVEVVPASEEGVLKIPVMIDHPKPGDFYTIKVVSTSAVENGVFMIGLSGVQIVDRSSGGD